VLGENCRHRARQHARVTVNACHGIDVHLLLIRATLYAVNRTYIDASQIGCADAGLTYHIGQASCSAFASLLKVVSIHLGEMLPLLGEIVLGEDGLDRASRFARAAVDALIGVNVEQVHAVKRGFVFARMDAVYRTYVHAGRVLSPYAGFSDNIRH
jgi:hypothetical protein